MSNDDELARRLKAVHQEPIPVRLLELAQRLQKALDDVETTTVRKRT